MQTSKKYKYALLDFDGTICKLEVEWGGLKQTICNYFKHVHDFTGWRLSDIYTYFKKNATSQDIKRLMDLVEQFENPEGQPNISHVNYTLLQKLDSFFIVSNNLHSTIERTLKALNIEHKAELILGLDDLPAIKPDPFAFEIITKYTKENNTINYYFAGDSDSDALFAQNCGIDFNLISLE